MEIKHVLAQVAFRDEKMAKVNLFETSRFFCDLYCLRPGQRQAVHSHAGNDKLYYALRGEGRVTVGAETGTLAAGQIVLAKAGEPHGIANESGKDLVCLVFMAPHPSLR
jgi:quercetin dioxygenase-like cupin family protein